MNKVYKLQPIFKDNLWGGRRLIDKYHKPCDLNICAESWDLATHQNGTSLYNNIKFSEILKAHPEYLGKYSNKDGNLPILIKFIDAKKPLSIQVHPDDEYASKYENSLGKTEFWYVIESDNGSLVCGFNSDTNSDEVKQLIENKKVSDILNKVDVSSGDYFVIDAGMCHSIGAGCLICEIQQNSDITYRMYDFDRKDVNGNKRELHIDKALDVLNYHKFIDESIKEIITENNDYKLQMIDKCKYFNIFKLDINNEYKCKVNDDDFEVFVVINGEGIINDVEIKPLDVVFLPSKSEVMIKGNINLLKVVV